MTEQTISVQNDSLTFRKSLRFHAVW